MAHSCPCGCPSPLCVCVRAPLPLQFSFSNALAVTGKSADKADKADRSIEMKPFVRTRFVDTPGVPGSVTSDAEVVNPVRVPMRSKAKAPPPL